MWIINYECKSFGLAGTPLETERKVFHNEIDFKKALGELLINENSQSIHRLRYHYETEEVVIGKI